VRGEDQHPFVAQREEVGAFPGASGLLHAAGEQGVEVLPVDQVCRAVEKHRPADALHTGGHQQIPAIALSPDEGIAEVIALARLGGNLAEHRVAGVLLPGEQVVPANGEALGLGFAALAAHAGVDQRWHAVVVDGAAGPAAAFVPAAGGRLEGDGQICPVNQVRADGVAPVHVGMVSPVRVVLVEQVYLAVPLDKTVGVVHPVGGRQKMIARALMVVLEAALAWFGGGHRSALAAIPRRLAGGAG